MVPALPDVPRTPVYSRVYHAFFLCGKPVVFGKEALVKGCAGIEVNFDSPSDESSVISRRAIVDVDC